MKVNNYNYFIRQLPDVCQRYPNLKIKDDSSGESYLKGILDIPDDLGIIVGQYLIEIKFTKDYPYKFPILYEIGESIPNEADWHKYSDNSCCITVPADEIRYCKNGITVLDFIKNHCIPFLANHIYRLVTGEYKNGEYAHGINGLTQFYEKLLLTKDKRLWIQYFKLTFNNQKIDCGRNDKCLCGGIRKYKHCHMRVFNELRKIGKDQVLNDFKLIHQ